MYSAIAKKLIYPLGDLALGTSVMKYYHTLMKTQWWPVEKLQELQNEKLRRLINHAYNNVPYYRELFNNLVLQPGDVQTAEDLINLPILTKHDVIKNFENLKSSDFDKYKPIINSTGGSTGEPLKYYISKDVASINWAGMFRGWNWAGYKLGEKRIAFGGSSLVPFDKTSLFSRIRQALERNTPLSAVSLNEDKLASHVQYMNKAKASFIYGYPSSIYLLADYCLGNNIQELSFKAVFCTAEVLLPKYRQVIESVFNCKVFDQYGSYDGGAQALECEEHNGFHISAEKVIVETVDDDGNPVEPGRTGRIIVTDLHNYAMPFIRYENGDIGSLSNEQCPCGRGLPLLESLEGRTADIIRLSNGTSITGPAVTLIFKGCNVKQYQLVQTSHNQLVVNIVKGENYSEADECHFMRVLKHHAGDGVSVNVNYCDTIPVTRAGKYRFIINQCSNTG
ncbi:MAG: hypothetical protein WC231_00720 [Dehalococcoidales bacterium]